MLHRCAPYFASVAFAVIVDLFFHGIEEDVPLGLLGFLWLYLGYSCYCFAFVCICYCLLFSVMSFDAQKLVVLGCSVLAFLAEFVCSCDLFAS